MPKKRFPELVRNEVSTDPEIQPLREWIDDEAITLSSYEDILRTWPLRFKAEESNWKQLQAIIQEGDSLHLWSVSEQHKSRYDLHDGEFLEGCVVLRAGKPVASLASPKLMPVDLITGRYGQAKREWLTRRLNVVELNEDMEFLQDKFEAMKALANTSDEFWRFCSDAKSWANLAGRAGIALVRDGEVVATIVTMLN